MRVKNIVKKSCSEIQKRNLTFPEKPDHQPIRLASSVQRHRSKTFFDFTLKTYFDSTHILTLFRFETISSFDGVIRAQVDSVLGNLHLQATREPNFQFPADRPLTLGSRVQG